MAESFNRKYKYLKGVYEFKFFSHTRELLYYDNKLTDGNIETSVNMGEITAGIGNVPVILLPDSAKFNITYTAADVDLRSRMLQTGGTLGYNGITDTCEIINATGTELTVSATPAIPYGADIYACYVNGDGTPYQIDPTTKKVKDFVATAGQTYSVRYYVSKPTSEVLDIKSLFSPHIGTAEIKMPVFASADKSTAKYGSLVGYWHVIAPNFQFGGNAGLNTNQTTAATSSLSGQALAYDDPNGNACDSGTPSLVYMVYEPIDPTEGVEDMIVLGGGQMDLKVGQTAVIPVKFVMKDGSMSQPDLTALTYQSAADATASVSTAGVVEGKTAGDTEITITCTEPALTAKVDVSVTA